MKTQHHFCFSFTRIELLNGVQHTLDFFTNFKIYLLHNNCIIGQTNQILSLANEDNHFIFDKEVIRCSLNELNVKIHPNLQIKLTEILQSQQERLIGSYQFGINNYIHISDELNRHCVELSIQIGQNYVIYYSVFVDRYKQGVDQIIQQHEFSKALIKYDDECDDFLPEEIDLSQSRKKIKEIKLHAHDSIIVNQRYWSPTWFERHNTPQIQKKRKNLTKKHSINQQSFTKINRQNSHSTLDWKTVQSTIDDLDKLDKEERLALSQANTHELPILSPQFEDYDSEIQEKTMEEMYQVIRSNSKITLPKQNDVFEINPKEAMPINKNMRASRKVNQIKLFKKYFIIFMMVIVASMLILQSFKDVSAKEKRQLKKIKQYTL